MPPDQFTYRRLNAVAVLHVFFELFGLLFLTPALQVGVVFPDRNSPVLLAAAQTFVFERAILAVFPGELEAEAAPSSCPLFQSAALAIGMALGTDGLPIFHVDFEVLHVETLFEIPGLGGRAFQLSAFFFEACQFLR